MKLLLLRLRRTGDIVLTTPAVAALKKALPHASLTYLVEEPFARLVQGHPAINRVAVIGRRARLRETLGFIRGLRREGYDAAIDFHGGPRASLLTLLSGARLRVGYAVKYRRFFFNRRVPRASTEGPIHSVENHLNLVRALGVPLGEAPKLSLPEPSAGEKARVEELWKGLGGGRMISLHIGAGNRFRDWGVENIAALIRLFDSRKRWKILLVGGGDDLPAAAGIQALLGRPVPSLVGRLNLIELRDVIRRSALFIGPDSGPMHIAASTATPIAAVFGPTLPAHFAPWKARAVILEKDFDCRPCRQRRCLYGDFRCLRTTTASEVFEACRSLFA